ncbi:MAG: hypothetical protein WD673_10185 [Alphaproteobacteria bacterium]
MRGMVCRAVLVLLALVGSGSAVLSQGEIDPTVIERFEFLSRNGNSLCSVAFMDAIPSLAPGARLQGSCCGPMNLHRYAEQLDSLKAYAAIADIPPDPYDVDAGLAARLLAAYDIELDTAGRAQYVYASALSDEGGPCCCECWRWHVFGGLGKLLIRDHGFGGREVAKVWNLVNGCGGEHAHG